ncbi:MAG TPA: hypothetical protein PKM88_08980 [bacterium]|nr:hypothetical protein [bacterium]
MATLSGKNLLEPGRNPAENAMFLVFLAAALRAVDQWAKVLRLSVATAGNDHRLGANEAPPAIFSVYLGDDLLGVVDSIVKGKPLPGKARETMALGVTTIPAIPLDNSDRNRTSPFAFTGNKFEFRAVGSSQNVAGPNIAINTAMAEALDLIATAIEQKIARGATRNAAVGAVVKQFLAAHYRIIFNGNGYSAAWVAEAKRRGLPNLRTTPEALACFTEPEVIELFTRYGVFTNQEVHARHDILIEQYVKMVGIEAETMAGMVRTMILPAATGYLRELAATTAQIKGTLGAKSAAPIKTLAADLAARVAALTSALPALEKACATAHHGTSATACAIAMRDKVKPAMERLRIVVDGLETVIADERWPVPKYREMLFMF